MTDLGSTALDSSVVVAAFLPWHEHHGAARKALASFLSESGPAGILPFPVLVESYSVMTRLPGSRRLSPTDAHELLTRAFRKKASIVNLAPKEIWRFLREQRDGAVHGGSVYDAQILACARKGGAVRILTFNRRHFERLAPIGMEVVVPRAVGSG